MKHNAARITLTAAVLAAAAMTGCSSSHSVALNLQDDYIIETPDGVFVGDSLGMRMKASADTGFALALANAYPEFEHEAIHGPELPIYRSAIADVPITD